MIDPSLLVPGIPGLDEALPAEIYAELMSIPVETVIRDIRNHRLLGKLHNGCWYAEAPPFGEEKLRQIYLRRKQGTGGQESFHKEERHKENHSNAARHLSSETKYAKILGLSGQMTKSDVKARWKELTLQYHPDKVQHLGPKLRELAEKEMKEINQAYDFFKQKYQI